MSRKLQVVFYVLVIASLVLGACTPAAQEPTAEPKELSIAVGTYVLNASYFWLMMPIALGYWEDMGYNVTVEGVGASMDAVQQLVGGNVDFIQGEAAAIIQANVNEDIPLRIVHETKTIDYGLVVPDDSDIQTIEDFRGKDIGVFSLASGGVLLLRAYLEKHGLELEKDVNMIAVGYGSQASEALNSGNVDALMLWGAALNQLENLGHSFRYFRDEDWSQMPEFSIATSQDMIDNDYQTVVDIVKGAVMATVFTEANPDCVVTVHWQKWPETKPADVDDATARAWDLHTLDGTFQGMLNAYRLHGSDRWGVATEEEFARLQTFLHEGGLIEKTLDPTTYFINKPDFWEQVNDFDHEAIRQQALACDF